jgi:hypothetical protein
MGNWSTLDVGSRAQVVAHELLHSVNVYHHGESDPIVAWGLDASGQAAEVSASGVSQISVFYEPNEDTTTTLRANLASPPYDKKPPVLWIGY